MIYLITGSNGAGKTLFTLDYVLREFKDRPVYYWNIPELKLDWVEFDNPKEWYDLPHGSVIVIDEAHRVFEKTDGRSDPPPHIQKLDMHRHQGHDLVLITQSGQDVNTFVRRRIHKHFLLKVGLVANEEAKVYLWPEYQQYTNIPDVLDKADTFNFKYPKQLYGQYKSADIHTKKTYIPKTVYKMIALLFVCLVGFFFGVKSLYTSFTTNEAEEIVAEHYSKRPDYTTEINDIVDRKLADWEPRVPSLPHTAPMYDKVNEIKSAPKPLCISNRERCQCYTQQISKLDVPEDMCRNIVNNGYFDATIGG